MPTTQFDLNAVWPSLQRGGRTSANPFNQTFEEFLETGGRTPPPPPPPPPEHRPTPADVGARSTTAPDTFATGFGEVWVSDLEEMPQRTLADAIRASENMVGLERNVEQVMEEDADDEALEEADEPVPTPATGFATSWTPPGISVEEWQTITRNAGIARTTPRAAPRVARSTMRTQPIRNQNDSEEEDFEMRTVGQVFGRNPDISTVTPHPLIMGVNRVGVEIEVERFTNRRARLNYWNMVSDGSLRNNGQEFTFRGPLGGKDAFDAIAEIDTLLYAAKPDLNIRCSTHVHVDVRDMTVPQLKRLILAYAFYESFLFNQSGRYRMKSNFCMPLCIAEGLTNVLTTSWTMSDEDFLFQVTERWDKYSAINLIPMRSYGSVEFRIAEGKSSKGQLLRLVNRFLALKEFAMNNDVDDRTFLNMLRDVDYRSVFQKGLSRQVIFSEEDFKTGWVIANDIATLGKMR